MKKYIVRLTDEERKICEETIRNLKGGSQKARRARILLQVDVNGPGWTDRKVADVFRYQVRTIENVRRRFVLQGFEVALDGLQRDPDSYPKLLDGRQEAKLIAMRLGSPPEGYARWSLRLLADRMVELEICDTISHETVNRTLKKTALKVGN